MDNSWYTVSATQVIGARVKAIYFGSFMSASWFTFTFFLLLTALNSAVRSQIIRFKTPNNSFTYEPGAPFTITWDLEASGTPQFTHADFYLLKFARDQFIIEHPIAYELDLSTTN